MTEPRDEPRIAFKAGRAFRREGTNIVEASATKGAIKLFNGDDGLVHFVWKNRESGVVDDDLILFPGDASFVKVTQSAWGRTYVLKFSSSDQRHFFWMQDADSSRDAEFVENVNRLLADPDLIPIWSPGEPSSQPTAGPSYAPATETTSSEPAAGPASGSGHVPTATELAALQQIMASMGSAGQAAPDFLLQDILTPENLRPLFQSHPELIPALFPHLPPDLPADPSPEVLEQIISSPQFRSAVRSFDIALSSGALQGFVRALGLPEEAGNGFEAFLHAIQEQADSEKMDTD